MKTVSTSGLAVCYHKLDLPVIQNPCLRTILLHTKNVSPCKRDAFDFYDDEGDNISQFNPLYAELTALYYLWKNIDAPFYGLFHYRRFLDLSGLFKHPIQNLPFTDWTDICSTLCLSEQRLTELLRNHQMILPHRETIHDGLTVDGHYRQAHRPQDLELLMTVSCDLNPPFADQIRATFSGHSAYYCTIFIAQPECFQDFCRFVFPIFEQMRNSLDLDCEELQPNHPHSRVFGFMGERLLTAFVDFQHKLHKSFSVYNTSRCVFNFSKPSFVTSRINHLRRDSPKVSVILPCYNVSEYLPHTFECLRAQTEPNLQIIAVNDESSDNTEEIIAFYAARDPRITLISQANSGLGPSRNVALNRSEGEYVHFFDPDDYIVPTFYEEMLKRSEDGRADAIISCHWVVDPHSPAWDASSIREAHLPASLRYGPSPTTAKASPEVFLAHTPVWDKLYSTKFLRERELRFHPIMAEDIPFTWEAYSTAECLTVCTRNLYYYRNRRGSITGSYGCFDDVFKAVEITDNWLRGTGCFELYEHYWYLKRFVSCAYGMYKIPDFFASHPQQLTEFASRLTSLIEDTPPSALAQFARSATYSGWVDCFNRLKSGDSFANILAEISRCTALPLPKVERAKTADRPTISTLRFTRASLELHNLREAHKNQIGRLRSLNLAGNRHS